MYFILPRNHWLVRLIRRIRPDNFVHLFSTRIGNDCYSFVEIRLGRLVR